VVAQDVILGDLQLKVEHIEVFTLDAADIALAKDTRAECPMNVLECGIVKILRKCHKSVKIAIAG